MNKKITIELERNEYNNLLIMTGMALSVLHRRGELAFPEWGLLMEKVLKAGFIVNEDES